jgi:hypothetical protein
MVSFYEFEMLYDIGRNNEAKGNEWNGQRDDVVATKLNERSKDYKNITGNFTSD